MDELTADGGWRMARSRRLRARLRSHSDDDPSAPAAVIFAEAAARLLQELVERAWSPRVCSQVCVWSDLLKVAHHDFPSPAFIQAPTALSRPQLGLLARGPAGRYPNPTHPPPANRAPPLASRRRHRRRRRLMPRLTRSSPATSPTATPREPPSIVRPPPAAASQPARRPSRAAAASEPPAVLREPARALGGRKPPDSTVGRPLAPSGGLNTPPTPPHRGELEEVCSRSKFAQMLSQEPSS